MIPGRHGLVLVFAMGGAAAVTSLLACGSSSGGGGGDGGAPDASTEAGADAAVDSGASDANMKDGGGTDGGTDSSIDGGDGGGAPPCTLPRGADGGAVQIGSGEECVLSSSGGLGSPYAVTSSMTIAAAPCGGVYDAPYGITVSGNGTVLTVEPGVTIAFGPVQQLLVTDGAGIVVGAPSGDGGACSDVLFTSDSPTPTAGIWDGVLVQAPMAADGGVTTAGSSISNLIVQYGGYNGNQYFNSYTGFASFAVDGLTAGDFTLQLSNVTLSNNGAVPLVFVGNHTGPAPGSSLTITDWASGADSLAIYPDAAGMLSNIKLPVSSGNTSGRVHLTTAGDGTDTIDTTQTWPSVAPWSYTMAEPAGHYVIDTGGDTGTLNVNAALTIASPNTLLVGASLQVEIDAAETGAGSLSASNVTFQSLPGASPWQGMEFHYPGWKSSTLSNVTFESVGPGQDEGCYPETAQGPPTGGFLLFYSGNVCEDAPPWSNLSFPGLTAQYAILPWYVTGGGVTTLAADNPNASIYTCPTSVSGTCQK
jgi:hypothetical protein